MRKAGSGKVVGSFFFSMFLLGGLFFFVMVAAAVLAELEVFLWKATPCEILRSEVVERDSDEARYRPYALYRYQIESRTYESDRVDRGSTGYRDFTKAARIVASYPADSSATCYVSSSDPSEAVLRRSIPWFGFFLVVPCLFIVVGGGGLWMTWRSRGRSESPGSDRPSALSSQAGAQRKAFWSLLAFGALFAAVGGGLFVAVGVIPGLRLLDAQGWVETPCTVVSSDVRRHVGDDSTTYSVDILYEYRFELPPELQGERLRGRAAAGRTWRSNRYDFQTWSSSGYDSKRAIVDRYPPGAETFCYLDPTSPGSAVLDRSLRLGYLVGLFPLVFLIVGLGVMRLAFVKRRRLRQAGSPGLVAGPSSAMAGSAGSAARSVSVGGLVSEGPVRLKATATPVTKLIGAILFCSVWNGIVSVFVWQLIKDWRDGNHEWFAVVFLTPFVLAGLGAVVMVVYLALATFNPRPRIEMSPAAPRLGETIYLSWKMKGASGRLQRLEIALEGREEATYTRGTTTRTDTEVFIRLRVVDTRVGVEMESGSARVTIPSDTMHSFDAEHNKIVWVVKVDGDIPRWPDVNEELQITIRPGGWERA